ncbi:MAG: esterase [Elusimicrobia bacterium RIFOXYA2_FULL_39_19]|nr:MAG: esterase [Elusimicrobia bacterium RIFOXYA2_FULL_39_19]
MKKKINQIPLWKNHTAWLDLYLLKTKKHSSLVIVFPGGGYNHRAEHEGSPVARWLNKNGISAAVCHYQVSPNRHPVPLNDAKRAIRIARYMAKRWNINPNRIGALGFSAGGHLVSTLGTLCNKKTDTASSDNIDKFSCRPDALVLCYPVISFTKPYRHKGSINNLLGEHPSKKLLQFLSSEKQVTKSTPPTFLWHTADDPGVSVKNSRAFADALHKNNVVYELHVYKTGKHGLGMAQGVKDVENWTKSCILWLKRQGF